MQERDQAVQKKAYKLLAHICQHRQDFLADNFGAVLEALVTGMPSALSAAKRHRLTCLQTSVLLLLQPEVPGLTGTPELATAEQRQHDSRYDCKYERALDSTVGCVQVEGSVEAQGPGAVRYSIYDRCEES